MASIYRQDILQIGDSDIQLHPERTRKYIRTTDMVTLMEPDSKDHFSSRLLLRCFFSSFPFSSSLLVQVVVPHCMCYIVSVCVCAVVDTYKMMNISPED